MSGKIKVSSLDSLAKYAISRILIQALSKSSDISDISEVCNVLGSINALEFIAEDVLDKLAEVLFCKQVSHKIIFNIFTVARLGRKVEQSFSIVVKREEEEFENKIQLVGRRGS